MTGAPRIALITAALVALSPLTQVTLLITATLVFLYVRYLRASARTSHHPGLTTLISPLSPLTLVLPRLPFPGGGGSHGLRRLTTTGFSYPWVSKYTPFAKLGSDVLSINSFFPAHSVLYVADANLISTITSSSANLAPKHAVPTLPGATNIDPTFAKPTENYSVLAYLGQNLVTASHIDWKRQMRIAGPAFSGEAYRLLWRESRNIIWDMMKTERWAERTADGKEVHENHVVDITLRLALLAIAKAGFGIQTSWTDSPPLMVAAPSSVSTRISTALSLVVWILSCLPGFIGRYFERRLTESQESQVPRMTIQQALHLVAKESVLRLALPDWAIRLPVRRLRFMRSAFSQLNVHIRNLIVERKAEMANKEDGETHDLAPQKPEGGARRPRHDLFNNLVRASVADSEAGGLSDTELVGNIYIFLLAGHETTAHTLAFTLALLALHPEEQERVYQSIVAEMPEDEETTIEYYKKFDYVRATYFEALRMFPPVQQIPRLITRDTVLTCDASNADNSAIGLEAQAAKEKADAEAAARIQLQGTNGSEPHTPSPPRTRTPDSESDASPPGREKRARPFGWLRSDKGIPTRRGSTTVELGKGGLNAPTSPEKTADSAPKKQIAVERGTMVFIDPPAVHYNPKYYPDPYTFKPERFMGNYNKNAFVPFSIGLRACIGRHFSEVESVAFLSHLLFNYSVHPTQKRGPDGKLETPEEMRERLSRARVAITLTPIEVPLVFRRRPARAGAPPPSYVQA